MAVAEVFFDTNVVMYLFSADVHKAERADDLIGRGGTISVQVLNEIANVARRKLKLSWSETNTILQTLRTVCQVEPLTLEVHDAGRRLAERYGFSVYDAMIVGAAVTAGCEVLYSEDMHHGLVVEEQLRISNPFGKATTA